jgi:hypothetical protein
MSAFQDARLLREFGARPALNIYYNGQVVTKLPLTDTYAAMKSLIECQDKADDLRATPSEHPGPFSGGPALRASDPFAQK